MFNMWIGRIHKQLAHIDFKLVGQVLISWKPGVWHLETTKKMMRLQVKTTGLLTKGVETDHISWRSWQAGIIGFGNLLGQPSADRLATGVGAERDVGVPERRTTVLIRNDMHVTGHVGLAIAANKGDGRYLQEIGTTGSFTGKIDPNASCECMQHGFKQHSSACRKLHSGLPGLMRLTHIP